jgi:hypothetical protein
MFMLLGGEGTHPKKVYCFKLALWLCLAVWRRAQFKLQHLLTIKPLLCWVVIMGGHRVRKLFRQKISIDIGDKYVAFEYIFVFSKLTSLKSKTLKMVLVRDRLLYAFFLECPPMRWMGWLFGGWEGVLCHSKPLLVNCTPNTTAVMKLTYDGQLCRACLHSFFIDRQSTRELRITSIPRDAAI